jgi:hypothetical protein
MNAMKQVRREACGSEFIRERAVQPTSIDRLYHSIANEFAPTGVCIPTGFRAWREIGAGDRA